MGLFSPENWAGWPSFGTLGQEYFENSPRAAYEKLMGQMGLQGANAQSPFGKYARGQSDESYQQYLAKLGGMIGTNGLSGPPQYSYVDFLSQYGPELSSGFMGLSAEQRGEKMPGGAPRARWIGWPS